MDKLLGPFEDSNVTWHVTVTIKHRPMPNDYDVIVLGLGAMGAAACDRLARRGLNVLGVEQFDLAHDCGSSHGRSRVIRKAYFEDPRYVPLLHATYDLWHALERETGESLFHRVGVLNLGPPDHPCIAGVQRSVNEHGLAHEVLDAPAVRRRFPAFTNIDGCVGLFEADAGYLVPEQCIQLLARSAMQRGATLRTNTRVSDFESVADGVVVQIDGAELRANALILTAGPWLPAIVPELNLPLKIERQVQLWFDPQDAALFAPPNLPAFIHFTGDRAYYGIPTDGRAGVKISRHHGGTITDPDRIVRTPQPADEVDVRDYIRSHLPAADGPLRDARVCMYTNTPDDHFILDRHPTQRGIWVAGAFSGHGFKFAPVVGEVLADWITTGVTAHPVGLFAIDRFRS